MTYDDVTRRDRTLSGALAFAMHVLFLVLMVIGVSWQQKRPDTPVTVDLWSSLPPLPEPQAQAPPEEPKPEPVPPKPVAKPGSEPKPKPKPEPKRESKPDIALKEKLEKERKERERLEAERRQKELEKKAALEKERQLKEQLEATKRKEKEQAALKAREEAARLQAEKERVLKEMAEKEAQQRAMFEKALSEYQQILSSRIRRFVVEPPNLPGNAQAEFEVVQIPGGEVLSVKLKRSSGVPAYDSAVERAILRAQPLPSPPPPLTFSDVRELTLRFRPEK